jgi:hypothetical protein
LALREKKMRTFKSMVEAEKALLTARASNPSADIMIAVDAYSKGGKFSIIERPEHLKAPSEFDGMTLAEFMSHNSFGKA